MRIFATAIFFLLPHFAQGAACCGGGNLFPSLISGDQRAQITATTSYSGIIGEASVGGGAVARTGDDTETRSAFRLDFATLISDRWQVGLSLPLIRRYRGRNGAQADALGLGDVSAVLGYEVLPQWTYSRWRPKGLLFASVTAPTGRSSFDSTSLYQVDVLGRGYWNLSVGGLLQKSWGAWDALILAEAHQPLSRTLASDAGDFYMHPGLGASAALGVGWSWDALRVGSLVSTSYEGAETTLGLVEGVGNYQLSFPVSFQVSYLLAENWSLGGIYSDNAIFAASNVPLSRTVSLLLQARWDR